MALNNIVTTVILDVYDHDTTPSTFKAIALDSKTRYVLASLRYRGAIYDIGESAGVTLTVLRPDGTGVQVTGQTYQIIEPTPEGGEVTIYGAYAELSQLALAIKGTCKAQFKLTSGEQILRTEIFSINNGQALDADIEEWAGDLDGHNLDEMAEQIETLEANVSVLQDDAIVMKESVEATGDLSSIFVAPIGDNGTGFINTSGVITSNNNYKYSYYDVLRGADGVVIDRIYVAGSGSTYNVISAYDADGNYIGGLSNHDAGNPATTITNVAYTLPEGTKRIGVTWGNMSSSQTFYSVYQTGCFPVPKNQMVLNVCPDGSFVQQFYFHILASELNSIDHLYFNARFKTSRPIQYYDVYYAGYTAEYAERILGASVTGRTTGIDGNTVDVHANFWNGTKLLTGSVYVGFIVNLRYAAPSTDVAKLGMQFGAQYTVTTDYVLVNDKVCTNTRYPDTWGTVEREKTPEYNPMYGGRLCVIGDSLTGVYYKSETESWPYLIASWNNMYLDNLGYSGRPIAKISTYDGTCMAELVDTLSANKNYTHIMVMGGANDFNLSIPIGETTDTEITTFKGAINHIISKLVELYPTAHIVFATTFRRNGQRRDQKYADAMLEVCKYNSIPCLNQYEDSGVKMFNANWMAKHGADGTTENRHLNAAGDLFIAPRLEHALKYGISEATLYDDALVTSMIDSAFVTDAASGVIARFEEGADNVPMKSVKVNITPVQSGTGDPSPSNVRAISGWDSVTVTRSGKNFLKIYRNTGGKTTNGITYTVDAVNGTVTANGTATATADIVIADSSINLPCGTYVLSGGIDANTFIRMQVDGVLYQTSGGDSNAFTVTKDTVFGNCYCRVNSGTTVSEAMYRPMLRLVSDETEYEPYNGNTYSISLSSAGTVYGGTLDASSGVLTVEYDSFLFKDVTTARISYGSVNVFRIIPPNATLSAYTDGWCEVFKTLAIQATNNNCIMFASDYWSGAQRRIIVKADEFETVEAFKEHFGQYRVVYRLKEPITYNLTPTEIESLLGVNNIWSDAGGVEVEYRADTKLYIDKKLASS